MQPLLIVVTDVVLHTLLHALTSQVIDLQQPFVFETAEEAFNHGIIPTRPDTAHGSLDRVPSQ